jgi:hypothetical protein
VSKATKSTQESKPPKWAAPLFSQSARAAQGLYNSKKGFNPYTGPRIAGQSELTQDALANYGSMAGTPQLEGMARGEYMGANPWIDRELGRSTDQIKSLFSGSGRYGSGANQSVVGENANDILSRNYQFERGQMMDAGDRLMQRNAAQMHAGKMQDAYQQSILDDKRQLFNEKQNIDWTRLGALQAAAQGSAGSYGTQVSTQRQPFNPLSMIGALGALMPMPLPGIY